MEIDRWREDEAVAQTPVKAEKLHNLPSLNWRHRKANAASLSTKAWQPREPVMEIPVLGPKRKML